MTTSMTRLSLPWNRYKGQQTRSVGPTAAVSDSSRDLHVQAIPMPPTEVPTAERPATVEPVLDVEEAEALLKEREG